MTPYNEDNLPWVPFMHEAWTKNHPNYFADTELDYRPLRELCIWIAKRNGIKIMEPMPQQLREELVGTIGKMATFVAGDRKYRLFSLDKINAFYRQEIMAQLSQIPSQTTDIQKKINDAAERTKRLSES